MADEEAGAKEAGRVLDALEALERMEDPAEQARAISAVLREQPGSVRKLKAIRRQYVLDQRAKKTSYRKIAAQLNVSLATVQDIERGYSGSGRDRPRSVERKRAGDDDPQET